MNLTKIICNGVLLLLTTTAFCVCQLSIFFLAKLKTTSPSVQWFSSITIVLIFPEVMSLINIVWKTPFLAKGNYRKWPRLKNIFAGALVSLLEMTCICLMMVEVAPVVPDFCLFPILNAVLLCRLLVDVFRHNSNNLIEADEKSNGLTCCRTTKKLKVFRIFLLFIGFCVFISVSVLLRIMNILTAVSSSILILSILCLSVVWLPTSTKFILSNNEHCDQVILRNNASIFYHVIKIVSACFLTSVIFLVDTDNNISDIIIPDAWSFDIFTVALLITCFCSLLMCNILTSLSTKYCTNRIVLNGATVFSGPIIIGISIYLNVSGSWLNGQSSEIQWDFNGAIIPYIAVALSVLLWVLPFFVKKMQFYNDQYYLLAPIQYLFTCYSCNPFFLTQHLFMNYTPEAVLQQCSDKDVNERPTRVFICTTMYREAEYEMRRLLVSLRKLSLSEKLKKANIYMETHIFLDSGADGGKLREFALQLLSLVTETLNVDIVAGTGFHTPYGLQMLWTVPGGMQIFFHFKDNNKVKAKKRWSQVMYIKYITEHRARKPISCMERSDQLKSWPTSLNPGTQDCHVTITVTDENGDTSSLENNLLPEYIYLTKDNLSMYSEGSDQDSETDESRSISSLNSDHGQMAVLSANGMTGSCWSLGSLSVGSSGSLSDLANCHKQIQKKRANADNDSKLAIDSCKRLESNGVTGNSTDIQKDSIFTISSHLESTEASQVELDNMSYILATDADMGFSDDAVLDIVRLSNENLSIGGICGLTKPIGKHQSPLVWNQMFEYGKDFWTTKSAQNVIGSVMCCPGCFSLYRLTAVTDVISEYAAPTLDEMDVFTKDTGEDRWMCTLMMLRGWKLRYSCAGRNTTYCPDNIIEFMKQRRRWILSDLANSFLVLRNIRRLIAGNSCFSLVFAFYLFHLLIITVLSPGTTVVMLAVGFEFTVGLPFYYFAPVVMALILLYAGVCVFVSKKTVVESVTKWLMILLGVVGSIVILGSTYFVVMDVVKDVTDGTLQFQEHLVIYFVVFSLLFAAILHPRDAWVLLCGITYIFFFSAMHMVLPVYTICNVVDQSWGTRENQKADVPKRIRLPKMKRKLKKRKKATKRVHRVNEDDVSSVFEMDGGEPYPENEEHGFWRQLVKSLVGPEVNQGTSNDELANMLKQLRTKAVVGFLLINVTWTTGLCIMYGILLSSIGGVNALGVIFGIFFGYSLVIQVIGMASSRVNDMSTSIARRLCDTNTQIWIQPKDV